MQDTYVIGQMNTYMHQLSEALSVWLGKKLPIITDNWWNDLVYNNLTQLQREKVDMKHISQLNGLDLASLLRVFDRNWFLITNTCFVNSKYRHEVKEMMEIRNYWAHLTSEAIPRDRVSRDVQVITSLMSAFDADSTVIQEIESFAVAVESDKDIVLNKDIQANQIVDEKKKSECSDKDIHEGSIVSLVSDPSKIGAVTAIINNTYKVWMDNSLKTFYREQIQLKEADTVEEQTDIERIKAALTAYQIANPGSSSLYSLNSARIDFVPYQFRPALKMIKADSPRLLVADDVGVGKTIEAGLILKEMEARSVVDSILIICPRPLVAERKWVLEMKRFDEDFTQLDGKELNECILETDRDGEWPERHKKTIIPYSLFGEDILSGTDSQSGKKRKTKGLLQLDPSPHFDLVIVDEAHTIRNSNTWAYKGVELFVKNADAVVFLTATPLQNSNDDLYTLLNLLRPDMIVDRDTFSAMAEPNVYVNSLLRIIRNQEGDWQNSARNEITNILTTQWGRNVIQHNPNFEKVYELLDKESITREEKVEAIHLVEGLHSFNSLITRTRRRDIEDFCIRHTQTIEIPFTPEQSAIYEAFYHNGKPFDEGDVRGVSSMLMGTKNREDAQTIGRFGMGFKSVFKYTYQPEIYSDSEAFKITNYLLPVEIDSGWDYRCEKQNIKFRILYLTKKLELKLATIDADKTGVLEALNSIGRKVLIGNKDELWIVLMNNLIVGKEYGYAKQGNADSAENRYGNSGEYKYIPLEVRSA